MPCVLVADANSSVQRTVTHALKELGIDVVAVANGEAAVRKLPDVAPDLILADIFMPVRSGYEVCEYVKRQARHSHVPVILLVGAFDPFDEKEARRVRADGVLKKPFVPPDPLINMVKALLAKAASEHLGEETVAVTAGGGLPQGEAARGRAQRADVSRPSPHTFPHTPVHASVPAAGATLTDAPPQVLAATDFVVPEVELSGLIESDVAAREAETPGFASHAPGPLLSSDRAAALSSMIELPDAQADVDIVSTTSRDPILGEPAFWSAEAKVDAPLEEITGEHTWRLEPLPPHEEAARLLAGLQAGLGISPQIEIEPERDHGSPASTERRATEHLFQATTLEPIEFAMNGSSSDVAHDAATFSDDDPAQTPLPPEAEREPGAHVDLAPYDNSAMAGSVLGDAGANRTPAPHEESIESGGSSSVDLSTVSSAPLIALESLVARDFAAQPAVESAVEPSLELSSIPSAEPAVESRLAPDAESGAEPGAEFVAMTSHLPSASEFPAECQVAAASPVELPAEPSLEHALAEAELESGVSHDPEFVAESVAEPDAESVAMNSDLPSASESPAECQVAAAPVVELAAEPSLEHAPTSPAEPDLESGVSLDVQSVAQSVAEPVAESVAEFVAMNSDLPSASEFPAECQVAAAPVVEIAAEPSLESVSTPLAEPELESGMSHDPEFVAEPVAESVAMTSDLPSASEFPAECQVAAASPVELAAEPSLGHAPTPPAEPELGSDMPLVHEPTNLSVTESAALHDLQAQSPLETAAVGTAALESEAYELTSATPPVANKTAADAVPSASPMVVADAPSPAPQPPTEHMRIHDSPDASLDTSAVNEPSHHEPSHHEKFVSVPHITAPPDADECDHPLGNEVWSSLSAPLVMPSVPHAPGALLSSAPSVTVVPATNLSPDDLCDAKTIEPASATEANSASEESAVPLLDQQLDRSVAMPQFHAAAGTPPAVQHDINIAPVILDVPAPRTSLTAEELESIVTRIVDRMQPRIVESLNRQILRPLIEALVHRELRKH